MAVILFYTPFIRRAPDVESLMFALQRQGHRVISLSQHTGELIHPFLRQHGIETCSNYIGDRKGPIYYLRQVLFFVRFCSRNQVDVVFSHLDPANFVASIGQFFIKGKVFLCRHHINEAALYDYQRSLTYRITNSLAKKIIVVSRQARDYMIRFEKVESGKILHINLGYDFSLFRAPARENVALIRKKIDCQLLLLTVCRLTRYKRPVLSIDVLERLLQAGLNAKLVILGAGPMEEEMRKIILARGLQDRVHTPGHVQNVLEYLSAADFLLHPSILESSCVTIKEAGLVKKPVIVCRGIGDFDDFVEHGISGFLVDKENFVEEASLIIINHLDARRALEDIGETLHSEIKRIFDIGQVVKQYQELLQG